MCEFERFVKSRKFVMLVADDFLGDDGLVRQGKTHNDHPFARLD